MLAKEMHIEFELGVQKLGSLANRKFYKEEIDHFLNRSVDQFIKDSIKVEEDGHGFEKKQIDVDRIRPLISKTILPAEFIEATADYNEYLIHLPSDYAHLVSDNHYSAKNCTSTVTSATVPRYYYRLPVKNSVVTAPGPYYAIAKLLVGSDAFVDLVTDTKQGTGSTLYTGFLAVPEKFNMISLMREVFAEKKHNAAFSAGAALTAGQTIHGVYFERYGDLYFPGEFIVVISATGTLHIITDAVDTSVAGNVSVAYTQKSSTEAYKKFTSRLVRSNRLEDILQTPYYTVQKDSPVSVIETNVLKLYVHPSWIVNKSSITYIRQPQKINLALQRNCELAEEFHRKIVDMAVDYAAGHLEAMGLKSVTQVEANKP